MSEEIANVDMARAWDGEEGDQWTQFADEYDDSIRSIWTRFLETDPIVGADHVLDIGCGNGKSTRDAARLAHEGSALGIDLSSSMLAVARSRANAEAAYEFVGEIGIVKGLSDGLDLDTRAAAHEQLRAALRAHETPEGVRFDSGVWLISATKA